MAASRKKAAFGHDGEDTPILANGDSGHDGEDGNPREEASSWESVSGEVRRWSKRIGRKLWKNRMVVAIILLLLGGFIALCIYFGGCVLAASEIIQNMSPNYHRIDPCANFDEFVCEGWREKNDLRADQSSAFTGTTMAENSQRTLRHILETSFDDSHPGLDPDRAPESAIFRKLKDAYDACLDEKRLRLVGAEPLLEVLKQIEKLFPAKRPHSSESFPNSILQAQKSLKYDGENRLSTTIAYLISIGVEALVSFQVGADDKDPDTVILSLNAPRRPGLPSKEYYDDLDVLVNYASTINQVLDALLREATPNSTLIENLSGGFHKNSEELVADLMEFEARLAAATPSEEEAEDVTQYYNPMKLDEVRSLIPQLSIQYIIAGLAPPGFSTDRIVVGSPSYLKALSHVLKTTSTEAIQAYFVWKTVQRYADKVEDIALKPLLRFNNQLQGKDPDATQERWRTCVENIDRGLGWILSKFFIEKAFSEEAKNFGDNIVSDIKTQFIEKLKNAAWMSPDVRELGIKKVHNIVQKIGYPTKSPDVRDSSALEKYYESLNISSTSFFGNAIAIAKFEISRQWSALGKPTDRDEWGMTAPVVNAYYNPAGNEIVFPAGIMQAPVFYDPSIPQYLSYGAFGSVSGHELSHAFDSMGRHYDETGNFTQWWDNRTIEAFEDKTRCFVDQYHRFTVPGPNHDEPLHVNGRLTLGENIADAGGLSASFQAWKAVDAAHPAQLLPGLANFTKEQLFFVSYSNWWCGKTRKEDAIDRIYRDPHAPIWARIIVSRYPFLPFLLPAPIHFVVESNNIVIELS
ncbi:MAG: hypothetical protein Q9191_000663 [Dirinaria sp. TL-2023a]